MCRSLPFISSILLSRSLSDKPMANSFPFRGYFRILTFRILTAELVNRLAGNFLERGHARRNLDQPAAPQRDHAALDGFLFQLHRRSADQNQFADLVVHFHDLIETATTFVSGVVADPTAFAFLNLH